MINSLLAPPPPFLLSRAALEWWSMLISTGRTPIRYDMVYMLLTIQGVIVIIFVFFSILCNKQYTNIVVV